MEKLLLFSYVVTFFQVCLVMSPIWMATMVTLTGAIIGATLGLSAKWFFYVLILVFLGGMMVLMMYVTALSDNEKFLPCGVTASAGLGFLSLSSGVTFWSATGSWYVLGSLFSPLSHQVLIFLTGYLLLLLFLGVKTAQKASGALNKFVYYTVPEKGLFW